MMTSEAEIPKTDGKSEPTDRDADEFFVRAPMTAAATLQKRLPIDETNYRHVVGHAHADARAYLLYGALDEVIKASAAGLRWLELLAEEESVERDAETPKGDRKSDTNEEQHVDRLLLESVIDEQGMWIRKLSEILFDFVLFTATNDQDFYRLYLLCKQLDAYAGLQADSEEFFACRSSNADSTIRLMLQQVDGIRPRVDPSQTWFIADGVDLRRVPTPGRVFRSARQRFMRAQAAAPTELRLVLGPSYEIGYSSPSRSVHPNVGGPTREFTKVEIGRNLSHVGLLGLHIVDLAYRLAGIEPEGNAKQLVESLNSSEGRDIFRRRFQRELEIGDIVFAYGEDLCQVVETAKSKYGNTSYKVRYLIRPMIPGIEEDWFPAPYVRLLYRRRDIKPGMLEAVRQAGAKPESVAALEQIDDAEAAKILARTFADLEKRGVLRLMLRPPRKDRS